MLLYVTDPCPDFLRIFQSIYPKPVGLPFEVELQFIVGFDSRDFRQLHGKTIL